MCDDGITVGGDDSNDVSTSYYNNPDLVHIERTIKSLEDGINWDDYDTLDNELASDVDLTVNAFLSTNDISKTVHVKKLKALAIDFPDDFLVRVLPALQEMLITDDHSDLHEDAALQLSSILLDDLVEKREDMVWVVGKFLLDNAISSRDKSHISDMYEEFIKCIPSINEKFVLENVLPFLTKYSKPNERVYRRMICAKIFIQLKADHFSGQKNQISSVISLLCQDINANVRLLMASNMQKIFEFCQSSGMSPELWSHILRMFKDESLDLKCKALEQFHVITPLLNDNKLASCYDPIVKKAIQDALIIRDGTMSAVGSQMGMWLTIFDSLLGEDEKKWLFNSYLKMIFISVDMTKPTEQDQKSGKEIRKPLDVIKALAKNYVCFYSKFQDIDTDKRLEKALIAIVENSDADIAKVVVASIQELFQLTKDNTFLVNVFIMLLEKKFKSNVISDLFYSETSKFKLIFDKVSENDGTDFKQRMWNALIDTLYDFGKSFQHRHPIQLLHQIDQIICERLELGIMERIATALKFMMKNSNGVPAKVKAGQTLIKILSVIPSIVKRDEIVIFLRTNILTSSSFYHRRIAIYILPTLLQTFSITFIQQHFLSDYLKLAKDNINIIKQLLAKSFISIKKYIYLPQHELILQAIEGAQRNMLEGPENDSMREEFQELACQLSRADSCLDDFEEVTKFKRETKLWGDVEKAVVLTNGHQSQPKPEPPNVPQSWSLQPPSSSRSKSRGKCVVTVTGHKTCREKQSNFEFRQSRLPVPICRSSSYGTVISRHKENTPLNLATSRMNLNEVDKTASVQYLNVDAVKLRSASSEPSPTKSSIFSSKTTSSSLKGIGKASGQGSNVDSGYEEGESKGMMSYDSQISPTFGLQSISSCSEIAKKPNQCMLKVTQTN
uniref:Serine/threonine-protein phosphatase 4 regulatory subunit 4 n=1 Tax=Rhabditophanes sp. KR3021 TaxID=114890 RepID=A0AC35TXB9_9BILA